MKNISHQEIDEIDQALIRLLSQNARITNAQLAQETGIPLTHVAYKGGAPAAQDLLGGQVPLMEIGRAHV